MEKEFFQKALNHVSNGGSLTEYCEANGYAYWDIMSKIHADETMFKALQRAYKDRDEWTIQTILKELKHIASIDIREAYMDNGVLKDIRDIPPSIAAAISYIETEEKFDKDGDVVGHIKKIKFWNKLDAIEKLGKQLSMFVQRVEHTGQITLEDALKKTIAP